MTDPPVPEPPISRARLEVTAAVRDLAHAIAAADSDDTTLGRATELVRAAAAVLDDAPRRRRAIPDFSTLTALRDAGVDVAEYAMGDRAVAGPANPTSVHMVPRRDGDEAVADVWFGPAFEGAPGRVHGGLVAAVFDDLTGFVLAIVREPGFTGRLTVNYHAPVPIETTVEFRARYREREGRKLYVDAEARFGDQLLATAEALFILVDQEHFATHANELFRRRAE